MSEVCLKAEHGDAVPLALVEGRKGAEPDRPRNFHQAAPMKPIDVPTVKKADGTDYSVQGNDPHKHYPAPFSVGYAHIGMVHEGFSASLVALLAAHMETGRNWRGLLRESSCNLPMNRNIILQRFLDAPELGDWFLFLDTDILFPPYTASAMIKVAIETGADIVAVPYQLTNGCSTFGTALATGGYATQGTFTFDRAYEIDAAGTGCMLISRALLTRMKKVYASREPWPFCGYDFITINGKGEYESDDYSLCHRAKDIGAKIVGYTGVVLSHLKTAPLVFAGLEDMAGK